jgi:hypothetical protein
MEKKMNDITLNSALVTTNASELQQALVIRTKSSEKAIAVRRRVSIGLVKPENEKFLTNEVSDKKYMVSNVVYTFPDIKQTAEARIDENGYLFFTTESAALATKDAVIRIICLVCTPLECIKSVISAHLHPTKGFIKAKDTQRLDMQFGDEIENLNIADLYTIGDQPSPAPKDGEKNENKNQ